MEKSRVMTKTKLRAVYRDQQGRTYSCPVEVHDNRWMILTSEGFQEIGYHFQDDIAGSLTFLECREETDSRIHVERGSGWAEHKLAYAQQRLAEERKNRDRARSEMNNQQPDPARVAQARELAAQILHARKPNGRGVGLVIGEKE